MTAVKREAPAIELAKGLQLPLEVLMQPMALMGNRGGGKTYGGTKLFELAHDVGVQCIGIDPIGNFWALRLEEEPPYPGEWTQHRADMWTEAGIRVPCPECGAALVWYEAGYVPGFRVCLRGHTSQLSSDCRRARRVPRHDVETEPYQEG